MSSAFIDGEVFAKLVGRYPDDDMLLFQVSKNIVEKGDAWSPLCRFRFVRSEDGLSYMEVYTIFDPAHEERK